MKILITGATGLIGSRFVEFFKADFDLKAVLVKEEKIDIPYIVCDLTNGQAIQNLVFGEAPDIILHLAAFTDVDGAQKEKGDQTGSCWQLNVETTARLANLAREAGAKIVYISTDFVFDGKFGPYKEDDEVSASPDDISWYSWTKLIGEKAIQESKAQFLITRTAYPYRSRYEAKTDFVRNIKKGLEEKSLYPMFTDQFLTPTFVDNLVRALALLIKEKQSGLWHVVDSTTLSSYEAALEIADVFGFDKNLVKEGSLEEFVKNNPQSAPRPKNGGLKNDKLNQFFKKHGTSMQTFRDALITMKGQLS